MLMPFAFQQSATVAAWSPLSLPLYGWYKGDAGLSVSTDGASVATWADQSGFNRTLSQATAANRMTYRTAANGIGGLPALQSAATTTTVPAQFFSESGFAGNSGFSFYIVMTQDTYSAASQYTGGFSVGVTGGQSGLHHFCNHPSRPGEVLIRYDNLGDPTLSAYTRNPVVIKVCRGASVSAYKWKATYDSLRTPSVTTTLPLLAGFRVGANYVGSIGGKIAEVIVCNRELTAGFVGSEEASLDAYFRTRYGFGLYAGTSLPVTSPALWIDGSRWDVLYSDAGVNLVTVDSGPIQQANDLSGNGLNASQSVFGYRPIYRTPINGQNGLSAIQHNSTGWYFTTPAGALGEYTAFSVMTSGWTAGQYRAVFGHNYSGTTGQAFMTTGGDNSPAWLGKYLLATGKGYGNLASVGATGPYGTLASGSAQLVTAVAGSSGSTVRLNGVSVATSSANAAITPSSAIYYLGFSGVSNDYHDGKTCETIIYPRILSGSEISQVEAYLKAKWNTP